MKKKTILMALAAILVLSAFAAGSLTYFRADGKPVEQQVSTRSLKIQLTDGEHTDLPGGKLYVNGAPAAKIEKEVCVRNMADTPLYTRITLRKSWGEYSQDALFTKDFEGDVSLIGIEVSEDWLMFKSDAEGDKEEIILYCKKPVQPGESTEPFMKAVQLSYAMGNEYADKDIELQISADAVQYLGNRQTDEDAMLSEWGVYPVFDRNGNIAEIEN